MKGTSMYRLTAWVFIFIFFFGAVHTNVIADDQLIRYPLGSSLADFRYAYPVRVLELALDHTVEEYGPARVVNADLAMNTSRTLIELERGKRLDVISSGASRSLEKRFLSVPVGIRKGILGIRLFLIDQNHKARFSSLKTLSELKKMRAGQGFDWLDTRILEKNGFNVVKGTDYGGLFAMLMAGRFDYFPRGVYEAFIEVKQHAQNQSGLIVEPQRALYYPYPDYFWVNQDNPRLAERLRLGMERAVADGSLDKLFESEYGDILRRAQLDKRHTFVIPNMEINNIPNEGNPNYWFFDQMKQEGKLNLIQ